MVVAVWCTNRRVGSSTINRFVEACIQNIDGIGALRIGEDVRVVPGTLAQVAPFVDTHPGIAAIIGTKDATIFSLDDRPETFTLCGRGGNSDATNRSGRKSRPTSYIGPGIATIRRFPETAVRPATLETVGGALRLPDRGINDIRIGWVETNIDRACLVALEEYALPAPSTVSCPKDPSLIAWAEDVT